MRILIGVCLALAAPMLAAAQEADPFYAKTTINRLAFDPARYFTGENARDLLRITYRGDDYDFPVWSLTIRNGCLTEPRLPPCFKQRIARMVRAPVPSGGAERPRWRGMALVSALEDAKSERDVADRLDKAGLDWVEADVTACPGAMDALKAVVEVRWPSAATLLPSDDFPPMALHADKVTVEIPTFLHDVRFSGAAFEGSPGAAAVRFAETLEPCWKPATAPVPWRNPAPRR
jgi:hypothetical protein